MSEIKAPTRRVAVTESIDMRVMQINIDYHITKLQKEGRQYFSKSAVISALNKDMGWPVFSDDNSVNTFEKLFTGAASKYIPTPGNRDTYSFQLKQSLTQLLIGKILRSK